MYYILNRSNCFPKERMQGFDYIGTFVLTAYEFTDEYALCICVKLKQINKAFTSIHCKNRNHLLTFGSENEKKSFKLLFEIKFIREV